MKRFINAFNMLVICTLLLKPCIGHQSYKLVTVSPNNTYLVEIVESDSEEYGDMAYWKAFRQSEQIVGKGTIYNASPPPQFSETYTHHRWLAENQLWLGKEDDPPSKIQDEVIVTNEIALPIASLLITNIRQQSIIAFDLQANSTTKIYAQQLLSTSAKNISFDVVCRLPNGKEIVSQPTHFPNLERYIGPLHFCLTIREDQIIIASGELEGRYEDTKQLVKDLALDKQAYPKNISPARYVTIPRGACKRQ